jgi:outer membrane lipoprotein-sorting protein
MLWSLIALLFLPATSHAQMEPADLLRSVKEAYANAQQYQFSSRLVEKRSGVETTGSTEIAVDKNGRLWFKAVGSAAVAWSGGREGGTLISVADGRDVWVYLEQQKLYKKAPGSPEPRNSDPDDDSIDSPRAFSRKVMDTMFLRYANFEKMSSRAKIAREESCAANGARSECYVLEIDAETLSPQAVTGVYTLWVDEKRYLVLRDDFSVVDKTKGTYANSILYDVAKINMSVPEKLFSFAVPQGVREVASFFQ